MIESREYKLGRVGQKLVVRRLRQDGWATLDASDWCTTGAPRFVRKGTIVPAGDVLAIRSGVARWVEVKTKLHRGHKTKEDVHQHGFDYRHFLAYQKLQEESGIQVEVYVVSLHDHCGSPAHGTCPKASCRPCCGEVLHAELDRLVRLDRSGAATKFRHGDGSSVVHWRTSDLNFVDRLELLERRELSAFERLKEATTT